MTIHEKQKMTAPCLLNLLYHKRRMAGKLLHKEKLNFYSRSVQEKVKTRERK
jgi:hypothetical protein